MGEAQKDKAQRLLFMVANSQVDMKVKWGATCLPHNALHEDEQCQSLSGDSLSAVSL